MMNFDAHTYEAMYGAGGEMRGLTPEFCEKMRGFGVNPWGYCADTDEQVYRAIRAGVSMITGNNPEPALRILRQQGLHK